MMPPRRGGRLFAANLLPDPSSIRQNWAGPVWIAVSTHLGVTLRTREPPHTALTTWPLNHIQRYGQQDGIFVIDVGVVMNPREAGNYRFQVEPNTSLFTALAHAADTYASGEEKISVV